MYMYLSLRHHCQCCSVATARVLCDLPNQSFLCICVNKVIETLKQAIFPLPFSKMYTRCKFYVGSFCGIKVLILTLSS